MRTSARRGCGLRGSIRGDGIGGVRGGGVGGVRGGGVRGSSVRGSSGRGGNGRGSSGRGSIGRGRGGRGGHATLPDDEHTMTTPQENGGEMTTPPQSPKEW